VIPLLRLNPLYNASVYKLNGTYNRVIAALTYYCRKPDLIQTFVFIYAATHIYLGGICTLICDSLNRLSFWPTDKANQMIITFYKIPISGRTLILKQNKKENTQNDLKGRQES